MVDQSTEEQVKTQVPVDASYYAQAEQRIIDKVVYLLGAGYSAPLALAMMSAFLVKWKDMYFADAERFGSFKEIFGTVNDMSVSKNYYDADLFNIEEILSVLQMQELVGRGRLKRDFVPYIINVIKDFTPPLQDRKGNLPGNWHGVLFSRTLAEGVRIV